MKLLNKNTQKVIMMVVKTLVIIFVVLMVGRMFVATSSSDLKFDYDECKSQCAKKPWYLQRSCNLTCEKNKCEVECNEDEDCIMEHCDIFS